jgi:hypothetical protein
MLPPQLLPPPDCPAAAPSGVTALGAIIATIWCAARIVGSI